MDDSFIIQLCAFFALDTQKEPRDSTLRHPHVRWKVKNLIKTASSTVQRLSEMRH